MKNAHLKNLLQSGYTLMELLAVMGITAIVLGGLIATINPLSKYQKSQDAKRKADLASLQSILEQYRADNSSYPLSSAMSVCGVALTGTVNGTTVTYLSKIPCDPVTFTSYKYDVDSTTGNYCLRACLSSPNDKMSDQTLTGTESANQCGNLSVCPSAGSYTVVPQ